MLQCTVQLHDRAANLQIQHPDSADFTKTTATNYTAAWKAVITLVSFSNESMDPIYLTTRRITLAHILESTIGFLLVCYLEVRMYTSFLNLLE